MEDPTAPDLCIPRLRQNDIDLYELDFGDRALNRGLLLYPHELQGVADTLRHNTRLKKLSLRHHNLRWGEGDDTSSALSSLMYELEFNHGLTELDLCYNPSLLCDTFFERCLELLQKKNHTLTKLLLLDPTCQQEEEDVDIANATPGMIDLINYVANLNKYPVQLKSMAYRARANDTSLFALELFHDPSDIKVYNEGSTELVVGALERNDCVRTLRMDRCCPGVHCLEILKETIESNTHLTKLTLASNMLTPHAATIIADAIRRNPDPQLNHLDLSNNMLDDEAADTLTHLLASNESLRFVSVEGNTAIGPDAANRLRCAAAFNCEPPSLKRMYHRLKRNDPSLTTVDMRGSTDTDRGPAKGYYTNLGASTLAEVLQSNSAVNTIDMSHNHVGPDGVRSLAERLRDNPYITKLDISHNPLGDEGIKHLVIALNHNDALAECVVAGCEANDRLLKEVQSLTRLNSQPLPVKALLEGKHQKTLPEEEAHLLDLSYREQQPLGKWPMLRASSAPYVVKILQDNPQFTELNLKGNHAFGDRGVEQLCEFLALGTKCHLTKINLVDTGISDTAIHELNVTLKSNYRLTNIVTAANPECTVRPVQSLEDALMLNNHAPPVKDLVPLLSRDVMGVVEVDFSKEKLKQYPPLGDDSTRLVVQALQANHRVTSVNFSGQGLSNRGAAYFCDLLTDSGQGGNRTITSLDLSNNDIGPDGASAVAAMLETNITLTKLQLHGNRLQDIGVQYLLRALKMSNRTLTTLTCHDTESNQVTRNQVAACVANNGQHAEFRHEVLERLGVLQHVVHIGSPESGVLDNSGLAALAHGIAVHPTHNITSLEFRNNKFSMDGLRTLTRLVTENEKITSVVLHDNNPAGQQQSQAAAGSGISAALSLSATSSSVGGGGGNSPSRRHSSDFGLRPWNLATVNEIFFSCVEDCPWLVELECIEEGVSVLSEAVQTSVALNNEVSTFRHFYRRIRDSRDKKGDIIAPQALDLDNQKLTLKSLTLLFHQLLTDPPHRKGIRMVNLRHNLLDDDAIVFLVHELSHQVPMMQSLYLDGNPFGAAGCAALREFVWTSEAIVVLSIADTPAERLAKAGQPRASVQSDTSPLQPTTSIMATGMGGGAGTEASGSASDVATQDSPRGSAGASSTGYPLPPQRQSSDANMMAKDSAAGTPTLTPTPSNLAARKDIVMTASAWTSIEGKIEANKEQLGPEKAVVMTLSQRRVKAATGNPFKKIQTDDEQTDEYERMLAQEAFSAMPKRQKYQRGQYLKTVK